MAKFCKFRGQGPSVRKEDLVQIFDFFEIIRLCLFENYGNLK